MKSWLEIFLVLLILVEIVIFVTVIIYDIRDLQSRISYLEGYIKGGNKNNEHK